MPALSKTVCLMWKDHAGTVGRCLLLIAAAHVDPSGGAVAAVRAAIKAVSAAYSTSASLSAYAVTADTPVAGSYADNEDKLLLQFIDADGSPHKYLIPSPLESMFMADKKTVDQTAAAAMIGWLLTNATSKAGRPMASFVRGYRIRRDRKAA